MTVAEIVFGHCEFMGLTPFLCTPLGVYFTPDGNVTVTPPPVGSLSLPNLSPTTVYAFTGTIIRTGSTQAPSGYSPYSVGP